MARIGRRHARGSRASRVGRAVAGLAVVAVAGVGVGAVVLLPGIAQAATGAVRGAGSGLCIDVHDFDTADGAQLNLWDCNGGANQQLTYTSGGQLKVLGKCLDASGYGRTGGTRVIVWACTGGANQRWTVHGDGTVTGVDSGLCLDAAGAGTTNGTLLQLWACNGGSNQTWSGLNGSPGGSPSPNPSGTGPTTGPTTRPTATPPPTGTPTPTGKPTSTRTAVPTQTPTPTQTPPSGTLNSRFRGMNWADITDNFQSGDVVPNGLNDGESPATSYATASRVFKSFKANFATNTIRLAINPATVSDSWWKNYTQVIKAANDLGMNVILGNWGPQSSQFAIPDMNAFYSMWDKVTAQYATNAFVYYEPFNEPGNQANWVTVAENFVSRYSSIDRGHILIDGTGWAQNAQPIGSDPRLNGTLISIHVYSLFGRSHTTYNDWVSDFSGSLSSYGSRIIVTEFGVPTQSGADYDGARNGDNNRSYFYAVTDLVRSKNMGTVYWEGVNPHDGLSLETSNSSYTSFRVTSQSALDRLKWAWHM